MPKAARKKYTQSSVESALEVIQSGTSIRDAARKYGVPRSTLHGKAKNHQPVHAKMGPPTILSSEEETQLVNWVFCLAEVGFPLNKDQLLDSVKLLVDKMRKSTPFTDNRPGRHWYESFLRRHPELSKRVAQNLTYARASATEDKLRNWFSEVSAYLNRKNLLNIDCSRIFNCDETAFLLCPKADNVLVRKGAKSVYKIVDGDEKECLTTLFMVNGAGTMVPPLVMYWYQRIPSSVSRNFPPDWSIGTSERGWMTAETFYEYITNVFYPWLKKNEIEFPVVLYVDGHSSHCTYPLSQFCRTVQIELIALYPNATHILQPLDVAVFHPMKTAWKKTVTRWRIDNNGERLRKEMFAPVLKKAVESFELTETIKNGFKSCGLCPFSAEAVDFNILKKGSKTPHCPTNDSELSETTVETNSHDHLEFIQQQLSRDMLKAFQESEGIGRWAGDATQQGLFDFWLRMKKLAERGKREKNSVELVTQGCQQSNEDNVMMDEVTVGVQDVNFFTELGTRNNAIEDIVDVTTESSELIADFDGQSYAIDDKMAENIDFIMEVNDGLMVLSLPDKDPLELSNLIQIIDVIGSYEAIDEDVRYTLDSIIDNVIEDNVYASDKNNVDHTNSIDAITERIVSVVAKKSVDIVSEKRVDIVAERSVDTAAEKSVDIEAENSVNIVAEKSIDTVVEKRVNTAIEINLNVLMDKETGGVTANTVGSIETGTGNNAESTANSTRVPDNVPEVFKKTLFWPPDIENTRKKSGKDAKIKKRKKVPTVATSDAWIEYHKREKEEQEKLNLAKKQRQERREEMQAEKKRLQEEKKIIREMKKEGAEKRRLQGEENKQKQAERKRLQDEKKKLQEEMKRLQAQLSKNKKCISKK